jgi:hypothetical protein
MVTHPIVWPIPFDVDGGQAMTSAGGKIDDLLPREHRVELERELSAVRSELMKTTEGDGVLSRQLEDAQTQVVSLEAKLQAATLLSQTQAALLRQRLTATARLTRQLLAANEDKIRFEQELLSTRQELLSTRQELLSTRQELLAANRDKDHLEREIHGILRSRSWRLTAPVRWAVIKINSWLALVRNRSGSVDA